MELVHVITQGDTLRSIALTYNISDWRILVDYNNLDYPFIDSLGNSYSGKNVKTYGQNIIIPIKEETRERKLTDGASQEDSIFGIDLRLTPSQDISNVIRNLDVWGEFTDDLGDISISRGLQNLKQALIHRLMTIRGELPLHPDYGCNIKKMVGKGANYKQLVKAKLEVSKTCKQDPRVKEVTSVEVKYENGGIWIYCKIKTIDEETFILDTVI